ncbi:hypothetical protein Q7P37_002159 [Cladosporium fusiforme]
MAPPQTTKRKRPAPTANLASRKRAFAACQFCRLRKTRCDNARPICGYCRLHNATCIYDGDEDADPQLPQTFDKGTERVLERLDDLERLWYSFAPQHQDRPQAPPPQSETSALTSTPEPQTTEGCVVQHHRLPLDSRRCESLLAWPVLEPLIPQEVRGAGSIVSLSQQQSHVSGANGTTPINGRSVAANKRRAFSEDNIVPLIRTFIERVLPRNPVLDGPDLLQLANGIAEDGLDWSAESCLVLLCCALSVITTPWLLQQCDDNTQLEVPGDENLERSQAFYSAAQKRLGFLNNELIDVHCFLFACIYEKSILKPMPALLHARQASMRLQFHVSGIPNTENLPQDESSLLQRAIESTSRAESELVVELGLKPICRRSNEAQDSLPQPPSAFGLNINISEQPASQEAQGWYFYLAEISLRRMMEDTAKLLHDDGPEGWARDVVSLVNRIKACEEQIDLWALSIPNCLSVNSSVDPLPSTNFGHHLESRVLQWRQMITLPLLYVAVHGIDDGTETFAGASKCIEYSLQRITSMRGIGRHGGTWFMLRHIFMSAMLLCSCQLAPVSHLLPLDWISAIDVTLEVLQLWSRQADDVKIMYSILNSTIAHLRQPDIA